MMKSAVRQVSSSRSLFRILPAVQRALETNQPLVALESTIVAHGMPYPENFQLSRDVAQILRERSVEPATIALKDGYCRIGLTPDELHDLARRGGSKVTTRQVAQHLSNSSNEWGATTVASTLALATRAGIPTFCTGGIGGVHRGHDMDVSADLLELARNPGIVVCAGIKSILDIPRTLETLETYGVTVVAYQTDEFPAFFSPHSGVAAPARVDDVNEIVDLYQRTRDLDLPHSILVAVPNADPAGAAVEEAIQAALREADKKGISGPAVTPFILKRVAETTDGDSLRSNMSLVKQNAKIGAEIAKALSQVSFRSSHTATKTRLTRSRVAVMGGAVADLTAIPDHKLQLGTSNPSRCTESDGGVGRNIAEALGRLGSNPVFFSAIGNDSRGHAMLQRLQRDCGVQVSEETVKVSKDKNTATYVAVLQADGDMHVACADMDIFEEISPISTEALESFDILVIDANLPPETLLETAKRACDGDVAVLWESTSVPKTARMAGYDDFFSCLTYATPNLAELWAMSGKELPQEMRDALEVGDLSDCLGSIEDVATSVIGRMHSEGAHLVTTLGSHGVLLASRKSSGAVTTTHISRTALSNIESATGAGDTLAGGFVHAILQDQEPIEAIEVGMKAAELTLQSNRAVSACIDPSLLN